MYFCTFLLGKNGKIDRGLVDRGYGPTVRFDCARGKTETDAQECRHV